MFICLVLGNLSFAQCPTPSGLYVTNITHNSAIANWNAVTSVDHYRIRTREVGAANWMNLLNINSSSAIIEACLLLKTLQVSL